MSLNSNTRREMLQLGGGGAALAALGSAVPGAAQASAPMLGVLRPQIYRFKFGSFEVTQILDGVRVGPGPHPTFGQDQSAETVHSLLKANGLPPTNFDHHFVPTLVNTGQELVLFDTASTCRSPRSASWRSRAPATDGCPPATSSICSEPHAVGRSANRDQTATPRTAKKGLSQGCDSLSSSNG
jgi:hypothetical protein